MSFENKAKLLEQILSTLNGGPLTPEMKDLAVARMEKEVKQMVSMLKDINGEKGEFGSMNGIKNFVENILAGHLPGEGKVSSLQLEATKLTISGLFTQMLWATCFNKTMPEAMELYKRWMKGEKA